MAKKQCPSWAGYETITHSISKRVANNICQAWSGRDPSQITAGYGGQGGGGGCLIILALPLLPALKALLL